MPDHLTPEQRSDAGAAFARDEAGEAEERVAGKARAAWAAGAGTTVPVPCPHASRSARHRFPA